MISAPTPQATPTNPLRRLSLDQLQRRSSVKWRKYPPDVLPLFVAEMDVPLAEPIARALVDAVALGDTGYPTGTGYAEALAGFARERWGFDGIEVDRTVLVANVMRGIAACLAAISGPADTVVVNAPVYPPFFSCVRQSGRTLLVSPLAPDHRIDILALASAFRRAAANGRRPVYLLCSPHNPTGTVHTADELAAVAALADHFGVRVLVDEIHAPVVLPGVTFVPYLSVPGAQRGISLMSASKAWNLAGLPAALAVAGGAAAADLALLPESVQFGASQFGVIAHTVALRDCGDWLDAVLDGIDGNSRMLVELLAQHLPDVHYRPGGGTFLAWLDCRELGLGVDPAAAFLERGRVALASGLPFGAGGVGHARLNLATSPEILTDAVRRMAAVPARPR